MVGVGRDFAALVKRQSPAFQIMQICVHREGQTCSQVLRFGEHIAFLGKNFCFP